MPRIINISDQKFTFVDIFKNIVTIPDCFVVNSNKIGKGHGEAKLYLGIKETMYSFFENSNFNALCLLSKNDLLHYMNAAKSEYFDPKLDYKDKEKFKNLWQERLDYINKLPSLITFNVFSQDQIQGDRGYINSNKNKKVRLISNLFLSFLFHLTQFASIQAQTHQIIFYT